MYMCTCVGMCGCDPWHGCNGQSAEIIGLHYLTWFLLPNEPSEPRTLCMLGLSQLSHVLIPCANYLKAPL